MRKENNNRKDEIKKPCLLLCEGMDEMQFLIWYLNDKLLKKNSVYDKIQILDFGGIRDLAKYLLALKGTGNFDEVERIAIMRDAETDSLAAVSSLNTVLANDPELQKIISPYPYFLLPGKDEQGNWQNGTLEDLCLRIFRESENYELSKRQVQALSSSFLQICEKFRRADFKRRHKNKLHFFLSATDKYVGMKVGEAARAGAYDWDNVALSELKRFLTVLAIGAADA